MMKASHNLIICELYLRAVLKIKKDSILYIEVDRLPRHTCYVKKKGMSQCVYIYCHFFVRKIEKKKFVGVCSFIKKYYKASWETNKYGCSESQERDDSWYPESV